MKGSIAQNFTFSSLMRFVFPTVVMMVFQSLYTIVDGIFVSRLVGSNALSSLNIVYPVLSIVLAIGIMFGTGGSAIVARKMGQGKKQEANENFSLICFVTTIIGVLIFIFGFLFLTPICQVLGASDVLLNDAKVYLFIMLVFAPISMLQLIFQTFFVAASKPNLGLILISLGGVSNIVLDYLFMAPMRMGIGGAALATGIGQAIPAIAGLIYFFFYAKEIHFVKPKWDTSMLLECCGNGSSEMVSNLSNALVTFLFNIIMMEILGEPGIAAITIVLYAQFVFNGLILGFSLGIAPVFSYHYGAENHDQLRSIFRISIKFVCFSSIIIVALSMLTASQLVGIFTSVNDPVYDITLSGFYLFAINFLLAGFNIFASALFTAFSNGKVSAIISFLRTFVVIVISILLLPKLIGVNGVWLSIPLAEFITVFLSFYYLYAYRYEYHYR